MAMRAFGFVVPVLVSAAFATGGASASMLHTAMPSVTSPSVQTVADMQKTVSVSAAVLRAKPTVASAKLAVEKKGTVVDVIEMVDSGAWAHVKVNGKEGYIASRLLS
jgi:hypothetical protein